MFVIHVANILSVLYFYNCFAYTVFVRQDIFLVVLALYSQFITFCFLCFLILFIIRMLSFSVL